MDQQERRKNYYLDPLKIDVEETWTAEKTVDANVKKTWKCSYSVNAESILDVNKPEKAAVGQTRSVIAPARGPILKEVREFIAANRPAPVRASP